VSARKLRVLIADDHAAMRLGLRALLASTSELEYAGEAADGAEAVSQYLALRPDLVVLDLRMPKLDGVSAIEQIVALDPQAKILLMTMYGNEQDLLRSIRAGALGAISKSAPRAEVLRAIKMVAAGQLYLPSAGASPD